MPVNLPELSVQNHSGCSVVSGWTSGEPSIQYGAKSTMCWHHARCRAAEALGVPAKTSPTGGAGVSRIPLLLDSGQGVADRAPV